VERQPGAAAGAVEGAARAAETGTNAASVEVAGKKGTAAARDAAATAEVVSGLADGAAHCGSADEAVGGAGQTVGVESSVGDGHVGGGTCRQALSAQEVERRYAGKAGGGRAAGEADGQAGGAGVAAGVVAVGTGGVAGGVEQVLSAAAGQADVPVSIGHSAAVHQAGQTGAVAGIADTSAEVLSLEAAGVARCCRVGEIGGGDPADG
jgi:hypothetical protein